MNSMALENATIKIGPDSASHTIEGWSADGDCFGPPMDHEVEVVVTGADGLMASFGTGAKGGPINYKLMPNSPSAAYFNDLFQKKLRRNSEGRRSNGRPQVLAGSADFPETGIKTTMKEGRMTKGPLSYQAGMGDFSALTWTVVFQEILTEGGKGNTGPAPGGGGGSPPIDTPSGFPGI